MIPADVASRLQASADTALRPVARTQELSDKLSGLTAGQRVIAEIEAMLPNGTYRAMINQRNITLALPFSAKSGDSLELEVTESDGKLALAIVAQKGATEQSAKSAVTATLSRTGQLIGELFAEPRQAKDSAAAPLNGNRPIAEAPPTNARELLPLLKEAIARSGMFYESHQAEWAEGRLNTASLLQEPQGRLSPALLRAGAETAASPQTPAAQTPASNAGELARAPTPGAQAAAERLESQANPRPGHEAVTAAKAAPENAPRIIDPQTQPLVHRQLEALATQTYVWQGQIWPGQEMRWEIEHEERRQQKGETEAGENDWRTSLHLHLPRLGDIDARISLHGDQISLSLNADTESSRQRMQAGGEALRSQLGEAGLKLVALGINKDEDGSR